MNKDLEIGSRVKLSEDSEWMTPRSYDEPTESSNPFGVVGTIRANLTSADEEFGVHVDWDNGQCNHYRGTDCDLIPEQEANSLQDPADLAPSKDGSLLSILLTEGIQFPEGANYCMQDAYDREIKFSALRPELLNHIWIRENEDCALFEGHTFKVTDFAHDADTLLTLEDYLAATKKVTPKQDGFFAPSFVGTTDELIQNIQGLKEELREAREEVQSLEGYLAERKQELQDRLSKAGLTLI